MKTDWARVIGWAIPMGCIAIAAFVIFRQFSAFNAANRDLATAQQDELNALAMRDQAERTKGVARVAAVPLTASEEPKFLNGLRSQAEQAAVKISHWTSHSEPAASPGTPVDPAIKNVTKIKGDLTVTGTYSAIRSFLTSLERSNRLYVFSDMRWNRKDKGGIEMTTTITRYIDSSLPADGGDPAKKGQGQ